MQSKKPDEKTYKLHPMELAEYTRISSNFLSDYEKTKKYFDSYSDTDVAFGDGTINRT